MPERSCIVCRKQAEKEQLIRFVAVGSDVRPDFAQCAAGRGVYAHEGCVLRKGVVRMLQQRLPSLRASNEAVSDQKFSELLFREGKEQIAKQRKTAALQNATKIFERLRSHFENEERGPKIRL